MLSVQINRHFLPEKQYLLRVMLGERLGIPYRVELAEGEHYRFRLPNGQGFIVEDHFFRCIDPETYLHQKYLPRPADPARPERLYSALSPAGTHNNPAGPVSAAGFDLFGSAFFFLTRWEELVLPDRDRHGRFPASAAFAFRHQLLQRPVVDEYVDEFWHLLESHGWNRPRHRPAARLVLSHDVDHPRLWDSPFGPWKTLAASLLRRGDLREAHFWWNNRRRDPFDSFDWLMDLSEKNGLVSQFNFLGERPRHSDCWYALEHPFVKNLMEKIARRGHRIGFHPSYEAFENDAAFRAELDSLRRVSPLPVVSGRQHYLRFSVPQTWRGWAHAGLETDSTLGFAEAPGFRCGTCHSFPVFDVQARELLPLREQALVAMDVSFALYRQDTPRQASELLETLRSQVKKHGGEFTLLWHNSSLNDYFWQPWMEVYQSFVSSW